MSNHAQALRTDDEPLPRPALEAWLQARRRSYRKFGKQIGKSHEYVRRVCLPFGDPMRIVPDEATAATILAETGGRVPPETFGPRLRGRP